MITAIPAFFVAPISGWLQDKMGPIVPVQFGLLGLMLGISLISISVFYNSLHLMMLGMLAIGFSFTPVISTIMIQSLSVVSSEKRGMASGIIYQLRQIGSPLGFAIMSAIAYHGVRANHSMTQFGFALAVAVCLVFLAGALFASFFFFKSSK